MGLSTLVNTSSANSIAIGCGAVINASSPNSISIGNTVTTEGPSVISIGCNITNCPGLFGSSVAIGEIINISAVTSPEIGQIAIGQCISINQGDSIAIGRCSSVENVHPTPPIVANGGIAIGKGANVYTCFGPGIAIGTGTISCFGAIAIGNGNQAICQSSIAIQGDARANNSLAIGTSSITTGEGSINIEGICAVGEDSVNIRGNCILGLRSIGIGRSTCTDVTSDYGVAIGYNAEVAGGISGATAIGFNVRATRSNTVTTRELETCVAGCGLIVKTPDGLNSYRIAVDNSGNITTALA
jgi:hypothetical protein